MLSMVVRLLTVLRMLYALSGGGGANVLLSRCRRADRLVLAGPIVSNVWVGRLGPGGACMSNGGALKSLVVVLGAVRVERLTFCEFDSRSALLVLGSYSRIRRLGIVDSRLLRLFAYVEFMLRSLVRRVLFEAITILSGHCSSVVRVKDWL